MTSAVRSLLAESRPIRPTERAWWDWALVGVLLPVALIEGVLRDDLVWRPVALVLGVLVVLTLWWRSTHPLLAVVVAFGLSAAVHITAAGADIDAERATLWTGACLLLLPYSLLRWGSGHEAAIGLPIFVAFPLLVVATTSEGMREATSAGVLEALVGSAFFLFSATLGAAVRYRTHARLRDFEQVRLREREQIARELHDTVAHHVSAIAIQAQAGRTLALQRPDRALEVFGVIEEAASRTLSEMRLMVGALRDGETPALAPQPTVLNIEQLAGRDAGGATVEVTITGDLDGLSPSLGATVYRIAQEAVTNARRHARHAARIDVRVEVDDRRVRLTVVDDGDVVTRPREATGYGLAGMKERAMQFGGTLEAGPGDSGGWTVTAELPRMRVAR